ncbi:MAG TPA: DUF1257 domain-containing protein [Anaerohalosphaeraceae bacterium]|nr:DUF1257 domain-containing protein [Anaerohalosphaeraceae bacterium]
MSHFIRIQTQIREKEHLVRALNDLHYRFQQGQDLVIRGYQGNRQRAEIVVHTGSQYDIGFQRRKENYEVVADWWGVENNSPIRQKSFLQQINRQYAYNLIHEQAKEQNLIVEEERTVENGDVVIILSERG